jgi:hypothetical protein
MDIGTRKRGMNVSSLVQEIERALGYDQLEEGNMNAYDVLEIVKKFEQPQLNENQMIVLDYLKDKCNVYSFIAYKPFEAILRLNALDPEKTELKVKNAIDELTYKQQAQVLQVISQWAQEQEEE